MAQENALLNYSKVDIDTDLSNIRQKWQIDSTHLQK